MFIKRIDVYKNARLELGRLSNFALYNVLIANFKHFSFNITDTNAC